MGEGEQTYLLSLTLLERRRHKTQGQRYRFKIGDMRPWKQEQRAWTLNKNGGQNQGKDAIDRDLNGQNKSQKKKNFNNWSNNRNDIY